MTQDIILLSTADWDNPFWTNKQHVAVGMAEQGFRILYVESMGLRRPTLRRRDRLRILKRLWKGLRGLRRVNENIWVLSPLVIPFHGLADIKRLNTFLMRTLLRFHASRLGFDSPVFWTYSPISLEIAQGVDHSLLIYHCVDDIAATPGMPLDTIRNAEKELLSRADLVFTTSKALQHSCSKLNPGCHYFPNVVDYGHFSKARDTGPVPADLESIPRPRIGFVGAVSEYKFDIALVSRSAELRPDWHWVLIGDVGEGHPGTDASGLAGPNIHLMGPRPYESLPDYLRGFDAAVIPAPLNDYTRAMFPMKFFEYLAAGCPVITTKLNSLEEFSGACIMADNTPEAFVAAISRALEEGRYSPRVGTGTELAHRHTWHWRTQQMLEVLRDKVHSGKDV